MRSLALMTTSQHLCAYVFAWLAENGLVVCLCAMWCTCIISVLLQFHIFQCPFHFEVLRSYNLTVFFLYMCDACQCLVCSAQPVFVYSPAGSICSYCISVCLCICKPETEIELACLRYLLILFLVDVFRVHLIKVTQTDKCFECIFSKWLVRFAFGKTWKTLQIVNGARGATTTQWWWCRRVRWSGKSRSKFSFIVLQFSHSVNSVEPLKMATSYITDFRLFHAVWTALSEMHRTAHIRNTYIDCK